MNRRTKTQRIKDSLLQGKALTGKEIMLKYHYLPYRNVILILRKRGLSIDTRLVGESKHALYSMNTEAIKQYQSQQRAINESKQGALR